MCVRATYRPALKIRMPKIIPKLKEKIMTKREATILIIIRANRDMGSPKMTACFLMFL
tara:strand:+ start:12793 stop:12966 length:174 start_codon:yes stop_codon:yes gene_type:complete